MIPRKVLIDSCSHRLFHTTSPVAITRLRKPQVRATVDNHEFHKIMKFKRPDELYCWDPRKTWDLRGQDPIDLGWLKHEYRPFADIINELSEEHRRLFTVEFGNRRDGTKIILMDSLEKTKRHKYDTTSLDFKITWSTWRIRNIQDIFRNNSDMIRDRYLRITVKELVDKRKKWLNQMRHRDYKRFEWIIEVLGLLFKLQPPYARIERKASLNVLVNIFCNELRDKKMAEYKDELELQKVPFLKMKLETLQAIREDELSVGLHSSVDEDIQETRKRILQLDKEHMTITPTSVVNEERGGSSGREISAK